MNIIIAGAGKVGFNLAKTLSIGHNVTIIDKNPDALYRIQESLDILPLKGDLEESKTYDYFKETPIDLFIAVTNEDNVNLISTMIADSVLKIDRTFVRLQKHFKDVFIIKEKLGVDEIIFPLRLTSKGVASLLHYPKANNIKLFKYTKHKLISARASSELTPTKIERKDLFIVGIERDKEFFIPEDDVTVEADDLVYLFGLEEDIKPVCNLLEKNVQFSQIKRCVVFGGGELGISIAKGLLEMGCEVKLIEKKIEACERADRELGGKATIINAKYSSHDIFEEENLQAADMFIAASENDEFNIIKCLEAKEYGIYKIVAINNDMEYYNLMHSLGIVVVRGPKISAYNKIMEEISSTGVVVQKWFCGSKATVFMRKIFAGSKLVDKRIKPFKSKGAKLCYIREEKLYPFDTKMALMQNDVIVAFADTHKSAKIKQWIYGL
ncbi:Trk system potassium uptake protein TrkA [hydrothermal vent metagenome]|uniref:Trk system potassium uptake protein TrkA n=1 Tax=hydrothermal vent metagenome TaxID=652676 RepID=A0A1W1BFP2_9ZZZZ